MPSALLVTGLPEQADDALVQSICAEFDGFSSLVVDASEGHAVLVFESEHSAAIAQVALAGYNLAGHILSCVPFESDALGDSGDQILIPIRNTTDQFVSLERRNLPKDVEDVAGILKGELPPLKVWIDVAMAYFDAGMPLAYEAVLTIANSEESELTYRDSAQDRAHIQYLLGVYRVHVASTMNRSVKDPVTGECYKDQVLMEAERLLNCAKETDPRLSRSAILGQGFAALCHAFGSSGDNEIKPDFEREKANADKANDLRKANDLFMSALDFQADSYSGTQSVLAKVGLGCVAFHEQRFTDALVFFKDALRLNPACPASLRFVIGLTNARLGRNHASQVCFARTLQLDKSFVQAIAGSAILAFNRGNFEEHVGLLRNIASSGVPKDAYPSSVLIQLAYNKLRLGQYKAVRGFIKPITDRTLDARTIAEALTIGGHTRLAENKVESAKEVYLLALQSWPQCPGALIGIGQVYIAEGAYSYAISSFEKALMQYPAHPPILKVLASLCYSVRDTDKALKHLQAILDASSKVDIDVDVLRMMCVIKAEVGQMQKAYELCTQAAEILVLNKQPIPLGLLNNLCVISANLGQSDHSKLEEALVVMTKRGLRALKSMGFNWRIGDEVPIIPSACVTFLFNFACILDLNNRDDDAQQLLLALARDHPHYTDAMLRLSSILQRRGNYKGASLWLHMCLKIDPTRDDVRFGLAMVHLMARDPRGAEQIIEPLLKATHWPPFAAAFMAHIREHYAFQKDADPKRGPRSLFHAQKLLHQVLLSPTQVGNVYAASALGVVLARSNHHLEALQIFKHVWELHPENQSFWENLALAQLHTGNFKRARQTLEAAVAKFGRCPYLCALTAAAQFKCNDYKACRRELLVQLHSEPFDVSIAFNVALVAHNALKSSIGKISADRDFRTAHQEKGEDKVLKPLPVDKPTLLQQASDLESSIELLQAAASIEQLKHGEVPKEYAALLLDARAAVGVVAGYIGYMDFIIADMATACTAAATLLEEDKYMKQAFEEQEALRMAQEMNRLAAVGNEYARTLVQVAISVLVPCNRPL